METTNLTLKEIVIQKPESAVLFEKYGLDFCCKGGKTLKDACEAKGLNYNAIEKEISDLLNKINAIDADFDKMELDKLIENILSVHHSYVKEIMPVISAHTQKVARVHGERHPEVVEIAKLFEKVKCELEQHMLKEEHILFPYIKSLAEAKRNGTEAVMPPFGTIQNPIRMMEMEHEFAGDGMEQIRELSKTFSPPQDACTTYRVSFMELNKFEKDLHLHIHKENNILFPKAIAIERELL